LTVVSGLCYGTGQKSAEIPLREQKIKRLSTLIEVNALIRSSLNLDQILENVMTIPKPVMNADALSLVLIDEKTDELLVRRRWAKEGRN
jgi:hypothetical protein